MFLLSDMSDTLTVEFFQFLDVSTSLSKKQEMEGNVLKLTPYSSEVRSVKLFHITVFITIVAQS